MIRRVILLSLLDAAIVGAVCWTVIVGIRAVLLP